MKRSTAELYGFPPAEIRNLAYEAALRRKIEGASQRLIDVTREADNEYRFGHYEAYARLSVLQNDILKAISFNEELLEELK